MRPAIFGGIWQESGIPLVLGKDLLHLVRGNSSTGLFGSTHRSTTGWRSISALARNYSATLSPGVYTRRAFAAVVTAITAAVLRFLDWGGMAGKITALRYQKRDPDRVSVFIEGRFAFGVPAISAAHLKKGQFLSDAEIEALQEAGSTETAYGKALDYLSYRPRSKAEVAAYVAKRGLSEPQVEAIVERLERAGLLNDEAFASYWVENRERFRPRGARALRYELRAKGIADALIDQALTSVDASASAYRASSRKAQQLKGLDQPTFHRKLVEYLARRGFDYDVAKEVAESHWQALTDEQTPLES